MFGRFSQLLKRFGQFGALFGTSAQIIHIYAYHSLIVLSPLKTKRLYVDSIPKKFENKNFKSFWWIFMNFGLKWPNFNLILNFIFCIIQCISGFFLEHATTSRHVVSILMRKWLSKIWSKLISLTLKFHQFSTCPSSGRGRTSWNFRYWWK